MKTKTMTVYSALVMTALAATIPANAFAGGNLNDYRPALWSGLYVGGSIGGAFADFDKIKDGFDDVEAYRNDWGYLEKSDDSNSITGGAHIGYNIQKGKVVFGVEGDVSFLNSELSTNEQGSETNGNDTYEYSEKVSVNLDYLASLRARIGIAGDKSLVYATAGVAFTELNASASEEGTVNGQVVYSDSESFSKSMTGLVVGGGLEYKLWQNTSIRGEVLHYMFELKDDNLVETDIDVTTAKVGISYHF